MAEQVSTQFLDNIPFEPDLPWLLKRLRIKEGSANYQELCRMIDEAGPIAHPRAYYQVSYINGRGEDWVVIDGIQFQSRVLRVNLENSYRVFPFLATCGVELQDWANGIEDILLNFWAEVVKEAALFCALRVLFEDLEERIRPGRTASMNPGSLADWPIQQQSPLFRLLGGRADLLGVQLTESMLMVPTKSVSGICFSTELEFENCQLCPREGCPGRRAVYNPDLYDSRYCRQNGLEELKS